MSKKKQPMLFESLDEQTEWKKEWQGMPEFERDNTEAFQKLIVNFKCKEDVMKFAEIFGLKITYKTISVWFPQVEYPAKKIYVDE